MNTNNLEKNDGGLEGARVDSIDKFSKHLASEINLAKNGNGFFEPKFWTDYLATKHAYQDAMNKFYNLLHELSK